MNGRNCTERTATRKKEKGKRQLCSPSLSLFRTAAVRDARPQYFIGRVFTAVKWKPLAAAACRGVMAYAEIDSESRERRLGSLAHRRRAAAAAATTTTMTTTTAANERASERGSEKKRRTDYDGKYAIIARKREREEESAMQRRERERDFRSGPPRKRIRRRAATATLDIPTSGG